MINRLISDQPKRPFLLLGALAALVTVPAIHERVSVSAGAFALHSDRLTVRNGSIHAADPVGTAANVIIVSKDPITMKQETALRKMGADVYRHLPLIRGIAARVPERLRVRLASLSWVDHVSPDLAVQKCDEFTIGSSGADAAQQQSGLTGAGVTVAVVDSGIQGCGDLTDPTSGASRVLANVNFAAGVTTANDRCGHGTHVAGIVGGNATSSTGSAYYRSFLGIAPQCSLVNVKVLDLNGQGSVSQAIAGLQWIVANKNAYNIRVVNLSFGHPVGESYTTDPLCQAVEAVWKSGITVVVAAGNDGRLNSAATSGAGNEGFGTAYGSIQSPANSPYVITVGATKSFDGLRPHDRIATYSSRGPSRLDFVMKPDIVAPGNRIVSLNDPNSTLSTNYSGGNLIPFSYYCNNSSPTFSNRYFRLSGTSMAAPVVSGAAALMLQANPALSPDTIKARLMISADKWRYPDGTYDVCSFGAGYVNIPAALANTSTTTAYAISPALHRDANGNVVVGSAPLLGGTQTIWGLDVAPIPLIQYIWGENVTYQYVWGEDFSTLPNSQYIWGENVWTNQYVWGESTATADLSTKVINGE
jgi:serine protease AprX